MISYSCRCGLTTSYGPIPPPKCMFCWKCLSGLSTDTFSYKQPDSHAYLTYYDGSERCMYCLKTRAELEPPRED